MGLFDFVSKQFLDIIQWEDDTGDTLVYKFPMADNEIQNGGKLVVRPGQSAVFVNEGQIADVFAEGTHNITTQNLPLLADLKGWVYGFKSPFKADVYFVSTKQILEQKWGTPSPILVSDPKFEQVQLRAFGSFGFQITDPKGFVTTVSSTNRVYKVDTLRDQLKDFIVTNLAPILAQQKVTVAELAANYNVINEALQAGVKQSFHNLGLEMTVFTISSISLPDEIQDILNERTRINMMGGMDNYSRVRTLDVMEAAAANDSGGGMMQAGMGLGAGVSMGQVFGQAMGANLQGGGAPIPGGQPAVAPGPAVAAGAAEGGIACSNCGQSMAAESLFCSKCGTKVSAPEPAPAAEFKFCTQCGNKLEAAALFCNKCGNKF